MSNLFNENEYIETTNGFIHKNDIPVIVRETFISKSQKIVAFFGVIILIIVLWFIIQKNASNKVKNIKFINQNVILQGGKFTKANLTEFHKLDVAIQINTLRIYNDFYNIPLTNVVLVSADNVVYDIADYNPQFKIIRRKSGGTIYEINLGANETLVKEIILMCDTNTLINDNQDTIKDINTVNIDIFNNYNKLVWTYSGLLKPEHINSYPIQKSLISIKEEEQDYSETLYHDADIVPGDNLERNEELLANKLLGN